MTKTMFDLNEEMRKSAQAIQERLIKEAMFGKRPPYSPFVPTGTMRPLSTFFTVIVSPYITEKKHRSREKQMGFWGRLWASLSDLNQWPYSPIEYYEIEVPAIMIDKLNNQIICHPSLEQEIKKAVGEGKI
jgi:hypothetical protein